MFKENILLYRAQSWSLIEPEANAPLLLRDKWKSSLRSKILNWLKSKEFEWTQDQVREKCFEVLWLLEELKRLPKSENEIETNEKNLLTWEQGIDDFYREITGSWNQNNDSLELTMSSEFNLTEGIKEYQKEVLNKKSQKIKNYEEAIILEIRNLLWYKQVRELFIQTINDECQKYKLVRLKMKKIRKYQIVKKEAQRQMISEYLKSKRTHWTLIESSKKRIWNLARIKIEAERQEKNEVDNSSSIESWFLLTQELLWYKKQMQERWFAMTESRRKLFDRITEEAMSGKKIFLAWSTWTWKTELMFFALDEISWWYEVISWHEWTTTRDIFWYRELWSDKHWTHSWTKPWPATIAITQWKWLAHDELTSWNTRVMLWIKAWLQWKPWSQVHIPW